MPTELFRDAWRVSAAPKSADYRDQGEVRKEQEVGIVNYTEKGVKLTLLLLLYILIR